MKPNLSDFIFLPNLTYTTMDFYSNETEISKNTMVKLVLTSFVAAVLAIVTILGNIFVIVAYHTDRQLQTLTNRFLVSLAVADTSVGVISIPIYTLYIQLGYWPLGPLVCDLWLCFDYTMTNASAAHLVAISLDRFLSIRKPIFYRNKRTKRVVDAMICMAWILSITLWTPWIMTWPYIDGYRKVSDTECYVQFLETNKYMTIVTATVAFYIPVSAMAVMYFSLYRRIRKKYEVQKTMTHRMSILNTGNNDDANTNTNNEKNLTCVMFVKNLFGFADDNFVEVHDTDNVGNTPESGVSSENNVNKRDESSQKRPEIKAAKILTVICLAFIITWLPYNIIAIMFPFCKNRISDTVFASGWYSYIFCFIKHTLLCLKLLGATHYVIC